MFKKFRLLLLIMAVFMCFGATVAKADLFFDSTGTNYNYQYIYGWYPPTALATQFQSQLTGSVTNIALQIDWYPNGSPPSGSTTPNFTVQIWSSSGSGESAVLGTQLWTSTVQTASTAYKDGVPPGLQSVSVSDLNLTKDQWYFAVLSAADGNSDINWYRSTSKTGLTLYRGGSNWLIDSANGYQPALQITGVTAPVPVPAAVWLMGSGLIGLIGIRRFRK